MFRPSNGYFLFSHWNKLIFGLFFTSSSALRSLNIVLFPRVSEMGSWLCQNLLNSSKSNGFGFESNCREFVPQTNHNHGPTEKSQPLNIWHHENMNFVERLRKPQRYPQYIFFIILSFWTFYDNNKFPFPFIYDFSNGSLSFSVFCFVFMFGLFAEFTHSSFAFHWFLLHCFLSTAYI